ncbi:hypothetical protein B0H14DRAFT_3759070 [Mycena olivaceomarginata]|nr:hypothetical protein B0H14DRAFT_3759070 [Mycena olivaceomarginata]
MLSAPLLLVFASSAFAQLAVTRTGGTLSLADKNGASGEQCLTFRNNGEIVEAACVTTSVDRQITPGTNSAGLPVLFVERSFGAAQAAPLVGVEPCIGFNGRPSCPRLLEAQRSNRRYAEAGELVAGTTCSTGVDNLSQLTISTTGTGCTTYTSTTVQRSIDHAGTPAPATGTAAPATATATKRVGKAAAPAAGPAVTAVAASTGSSTNAAVTRTSGTLCLADDKGVAGEQCITFRNNGEIVEAACVTTAVDRQITPATNAAGLPVLLVERSFGAAQAAPLVGVQPCIGFNGTDFLAQDCSTLTAATAATLSAEGELVAGTACSTGVDSVSQLTVSTTGAGCTTYTSTVVQRTTDNAGAAARRASSGMRMRTVRRASSRSLVV